MLKNVCVRSPVSTLSCPEMNKNGFLWVVPHRNGKPHFSSNKSISLAGSPLHLCSLNHAGATLISSRGKLKRQPCDYGENLAPTSLWCHWPPLIHISHSYCLFDSKAHIWKVIIGKVEKEMNCVICALILRDLKILHHLHILNIQLHPRL